ncbi:uncharacterized protein LOC135122426 [Zophobas morio]|uniref:uncharacterized protein LOC135122426 n=1 Tax=Zophobas morio TaxID=2755281 RepID=UPI003083CD49
MHDFINKQEDIDELSFTKNVARSNETVDIKRKRLKYQGKYRGILESSLLLSNFCDTKIPELNEEELNDLDRLLSENDWDIYSWITGRAPLPEVHKTTVFEKINHFSKNELKSVLKKMNLQ